MGCTSSSTQQKQALSQKDEQPEAQATETKTAEKGTTILEQGSAVTDTTGGEAGKGAAVTDTTGSEAGKGAAVTDTAGSEAGKAIVAPSEAETPAVTNPANDAGNKEVIHTATDADEKTVPTATDDLTGEAAANNPAKDEVANNPAKDEVGKEVAADLVGEQQGGTLVSAPAETEVQTVSALSGTADETEKKKAAACEVVDDSNKGSNVVDSKEKSKSCFCSSSSKTDENEISVS